MTSDPDITALRAIPHDSEGPVFREPWEARAFAMAVSLSGRGVFTWTEWAETLAREIAIDRDASDYYRFWLQALEKLAIEKGAVTPQSLAKTAKAWKDAAEQTPHGQPIELKPS